MSKIEQMIPYVRLLKTGELYGSKTNESEVAKCVKLRWATGSGRKNHYVITEQGRARISEFLWLQLPEWESYFKNLEVEGFPLTADGVLEYESVGKMGKLELPAMIHHKTLACCGGRHSKSGISKNLEKLAAGTVITTDQILRINANHGLVFEMQDIDELACDQIMAIFGEVAIPERAFIDGINVTGKMPKAIFTIENRGAYIDFPRVSSELLLIHAPGDDIALAIKLLNLFPDNIPYYHFGDIDPKGLKIINNIKQKVSRSMQLFLPAFWIDYVNEAFIGTRQWPEGDIVDVNSNIIKILRKEKKWLEQERIMLDPRLQTEILKLV